MTLPADIARCAGHFLSDLGGDIERPMELQCSRRNECLRYLHRDTGHTWLLPRVEDGQCFDRLTEAGLPMLKR